MATVAGLVSEISIAIGTKDPLFECTGWRFPAFRTLVRAQVIFGIIVGLVASFAEAAVVVERFDVANDVVVAIVQIDMEHLDGRLSAEYQLPKSVPDHHLVQRSMYFLHFRDFRESAGHAGSSSAFCMRSKASRFCIACLL